MKRLSVATGLGAVGALGIGLLAATGAVAADRVDDPTKGATSTCTQDGPRTTGGLRDPRGPGGPGAGGQQGSGGQQGNGGQQGKNGRQGTAARSGDHTAYPSGELTVEQQEGLVFMAQEEKLAYDLYVAFGEQFDVATFDRIAASEAQHLTAIRTLLATYELTDPTVGLAPGEFADPDLAGMYTALLAQGSASLESAMAVGRSVELDDIAGLDEAASGVTAPDVAHTYARLKTASERHLAAFGG